MGVKRYNVVRPKKYVKDGEEKTQWLQVGTLVQFDNGGFGLELNHTSEKFMIFEQKEKGDYNSPKKAYNKPQEQSYDSGEIRVEDINF